MEEGVSKVYITLQQPFKIVMAIWNVCGCVCVCVYEYEVFQPYTQVQDPKIPKT